MIPVLAIPALNRPDLLRRCLVSIDVPVERLLVIDNSPDGSMDPGMGGEVIRVGANLGVAASWNLALKANPRAPWWAIASVDVEFGSGDLGRLAAYMERDEPAVGCLLRFGAFGLNRAALDAVGYFDESFHPIYCEDCDYEYRCKLAGVPIVDVGSRTVHLESGSVSLHAGHALDNARSFPANHAYYRAKWGGPVRGGEVFTTPFDRGGSIRDWTLDPARLRELAWNA
jgi:GT2 family glycosyltransferase